MELLDSIIVSLLITNIFTKRQLTNNALKAILGNGRKRFFRMPYEIQFKASAWKTFNKLDREARGRVAEAIMGLSENPKPQQARKLSGAEDFYRVRVGDFRVIYQVREGALVVLIIKVGHRRDVYKTLRRR